MNKRLKWHIDNNILINNDLTFIFLLIIKTFVYLRLMINDIMKLITVKRQTKTEKRHTPRMGELLTKVTYIKMVFLNIPYKTLHKYRETYYGEVRDCADCNLAS